MHNRIVSTAALAGFTSLAVLVGLAIRVAFGAIRGALSEPFAVGVAAGSGYSRGFYLVVLLALAAAGVLSMTAFHLSHGRRAAARVKVRSAQGGRDPEDLRPDDRRSD